MMKTVSVIIPFYSHIDWLYEAIESVLAQSYPIHEIILVNDGSKEDMTEFLKKYGDKIQYIYQENASHWSVGTFTSLGALLYTIFVVLSVAVYVTSIFALF